MTIKGTFFLYSDNGGSYWAIQDENFIRGDFWEYAGLHPLHEGDYLKVFNPDGTVYFEGVVQLEKLDGYPFMKRLIGELTRNGK